MFLKNQQTGVLVEVSNVEDLINPLHGEITGRVQSGQEEQDPEAFSKDILAFPSDETLPRCWKDPDYQTES